MSIEPGMTFGRLTVIAIIEDRIRIEGGRERKYPMARVVCSCGAERDVYQSNLRRGLSTSCGCLTTERARAARRAGRVQDPTYAACHLRVKRERGHASEHVCPCGKPAEGWAYSHTDPDELTSPFVSPSGHVSMLVHSGDPDHYVAMCRKCHAHYDRLARYVRAAGIFPRDVFARRGVDLETAEKMRAAMPDPELFEIVSEDELALEMGGLGVTLCENGSGPEGALTPTPALTPHHSTLPRSEG